MPEGEACVSDGDTEWGEASVEQGTDSSLDDVNGLENTKFSVHSVLQGQSCGGQSHHFLLWVPVGPESVQGQGGTFCKILIFGAPGWLS